MRVLQVTPSLTPGGAQNMVVGLSLALAGRGVDVQVISLWGPDRTVQEERLHDAGIPVHFLGKQKGFDPRMFPLLSRLLAANCPDVLHTHLEGLRYAGPPAVWHRIDVKVHTVHNLAEREVGLPMRQLHRLFFRFGFQPISIAARVSESIRQAYGIRSPILVPNGIDVASIRTPSLPREEWRIRESLKPETVLFVALGRIEAQKDHALLIRAFAEEFRDRPEAVLLVAGRSTPLSEALADLAKDLGVGDRVRLTGSRDDVADLLHGADVFVSSSRWEGNPLAVMEAMACGCPVVATAVGGVPELVAESGGGALVPSGDQEALGRALRALFEDPTRRHTMGERARAHADECFDSGLMAERYIDVYRRLRRRQTNTDEGSRTPPAGTGDR